MGGQSNPASSVYFLTKIIVMDNNLLYNLIEEPDRKFKESPEVTGRVYWRFSPVVVEKKVRLKNSTSVHIRCFSFARTTAAGWSNFT
jgi:hypothetical protein